MSEPTDLPLNASTALARTVLDTLVERGLRELVLCPGSRSTPLALHAHTLAVRGRLRLHTRLDERTAAFLALGLAKSSQTPAAVLTTSGTAVAHLHPAVLEASHAGVPLVLLTADRPEAMRGTGANQTTDFAVTFGAACVSYIDVPPGEVGAEESQVAAWRAHVADVLRRLRLSPGPAHLNLQLAPPLVPGTPDGWQHPADLPPISLPALGGVLESEPVALPTDLRTVVVAGDDAGPPARRLAEQAGWPLLAEPSSGARTGTHALRTYRLLLDDPGLVEDVEQVVVAGHPTLSRPVTALLGRSDVDHVALLPRTDRTGRRTVTDLAGRARLRAAALVPDGTADPAWLERWRQRDREVGAALDALLARQDALLPHHVAAAVGAALPPGGLLVVGASNPIRDLDLVLAPYAVGERRLVLANRGLSGIDGTVSTALGAALGRPGSSRALALMGDLTFLHDHGGLLLGEAEERPDLTIVVVNDGGGSIFAGLEQGGPEHADSFERVFALPHRVDLGSLCAASRTPYTQVRSRGELEASLASPHGGVEVVEAVVDRSGRRDLDARIRALATG